jgi:hypothetical protein
LREGITRGKHLPHRIDPDIRMKRLQGICVYGGMAPGNDGKLLADPSSSCGLPGVPYWKDRQPPESATSTGQAAGN